MRTRDPRRSRGAVSIWLALAATALIAATIAVEPRSPSPGAPAQDTIDGAKPGMKIDDPNSLENEKPPADVSRLVLGYGINNYGYIDVCGCKHKKIRQGSITRRAALIRQLRVRVPELLLVDGGNTLFGREDRLAKDHERPQLVEKAKVLIESYNRMGYRAMTFGHFDLSLGLETLKDLLSRADFPCVCANFVYAESGETVFPPFVEIEAGGVKVGVLGLTNTLQPHFLASKAPGTAMIDTLEAARRWVPELRERNDAVIVLSQNSLDFNQKLAREVEGIDFILDPHFKLGSSKIWIEEDELVEPVGQTYILRGDAQGARLQTLDLWIRPDGDPFADRSTTESGKLVGDGELAQRSSFRQRRFPIEPHFLEDPDIVQLVDTFRKGTRFVDTALLPELPNKDQYLTQEACGVCHEEQHKFWAGTTHAHAFASLEETGDQWRQDCIGCHTLGYGQTFLLPKDAEPYKNVQCESCHGLNPKHPEDPVAHQWPRVREMSCLTCHNKAQTLVDFNFIESRRKVACPPMQR